MNGLDVIGKNCSILHHILHKNVMHPLAGVGLENRYFPGRVLTWKSTFPPLPTSYLRTSNHSYFLLPQPNFLVSIQWLFDYLCWRGKDASMHSLHTPSLFVSLSLTPMSLRAPKLSLFLSLTPVRSIVGHDLQCS